MDIELVLTEDIVQKIIDEGLTDSMDVFGYISPLIATIEAGREDLAIMLVEDGASLNIEERPLMHALKHNMYKCAKLMIQYSGRPNYTPTGQISSISSFCLLGDLEAVRFLYENGARIRGERSSLTYCVLCEDAVKGHACLKYLLDKGEDANYASDNGETALSAALKYNNQLCFDELIKHGGRIL